MNNNAGKDYRYNKNLGVGERLAARRKLLQLTQQEVADKLGMRRGTYAMYESGLNMFPSTELPRAAEVLRCSANYILGIPETINEEIVNLYEGLRSDLKPAAKTVLKSMFDSQGLEEKTDPK